MMVSGYLQAVQSRWLADLRQHLGLDLFRVVRHCRSFVLVRRSVLGFFHYFLGLVKGDDSDLRHYTFFSVQYRQECLFRRRRFKLPVSSPVPEPVPVIIDKLKVGTIIGHSQLDQRQVDLVFPLAGLAINAIQIIPDVLDGV